MTHYSTEELDQRIEQLLDCTLPDRPTADINVALKVADLMESRGYNFQIQDMCPKSLHETLWKAVFASQNSEYVAEAPQSAVAICTAAVAALDATETA